MSKEQLRFPDGTIQEKLVDKNACRYLVNEVCVNQDCDCCLDLPAYEYCRKCQLFEKDQ